MAADSAVGADSAVDLNDVGDDDITEDITVPRAVSEDELCGDVDSRCFGTEADTNDLFFARRDRSAGSGGPSSSRRLNGSKDFILSCRCSQMQKTITRNEPVTSIMMNEDNGWEERERHPRKRDTETEFRAGYRIETPHRNR